MADTMPPAAAPDAAPADDGAKLESLVTELAGLLKSAGPEAAKAVLEQLAAQVMEGGEQESQPMGAQTPEQGASGARPMGMG